MGHRAETLRVVVQRPDLAVAEIRRFFDRGPLRGEVWVETDAGRVCALVSGERAWMMWLRAGDDAGLSSRDPSYAGPPEAVLPFVLGNGQLDHHPASWTLPVARVASALEYFARTGGMPSDLTWHDDSDDDG